MEITREMIDKLSNYDLKHYLRTGQYLVTVKTQKQLDDELVVIEPVFEAPVVVTDISDDVPVIDTPVVNAPFLIDTTEPVVDTFEPTDKFISDGVVLTLPEDAIEPVVIFEPIVEAPLEDKLLLSEDELQMNINNETVKKIKTKK